MPGQLLSGVGNDGDDTLYSKLDGHEPYGGTARPENGPRTRDYPGRRLAYAYTMDGLSIDVLMIGEGLAETWTRHGQHRDTLVALEQAARENGAGCLWGGLSESPNARPRT